MQRDRIEERKKRDRERKKNLTPASKDLRWPFPLQRKGAKLPHEDQTQGRLFGLPLFSLGGQQEGFAGGRRSEETPLRSGETISAASDLKGTEGNRRRSSFQALHHALRGFGHTVAALHLVFMAKASK